MKLYPAIDIKGGKCVRLTQGRADQEVRYHDDPLIPARQFRDAGAEWIHVVDLDGAFDGSSANLEAVRAICALFPQVELGGGLRDIAALEAVFSAGVQRAIIGTQAVKDPGFVKQAVDRFGQRIAVGIDARNGKVATAGWVDVSSLDALEFAADMAAIGVGAIIYTDISRDGMLTGPNFEAQEAMLSAVSTPIIASGGVASLDDIRRFAELAKEYPNLDGVIIGKALYEKRFTLAEALAV